MASCYRMLKVSYADKSGEIRPKYEFPVSLVIEYDPQGISVKLKQDGREDELAEFPIYRSTECARVGAQVYVVSIDNESLFLKFKDETGLYIIFFCI
ncbi:hypothetical protein C0J52_13202 [Blattella germanica]|nr:hypothetical protein C0J52_13202 [Blattella germanica]